VDNFVGEGAKIRSNQVRGGFRKAAFILRSAMAVTVFDGNEAPRGKC
jgi:hypothetical protein